MNEITTNTELVQYFMEYSHHGALSQMFVIESLRRYATLLDKLTDDQIEAIESIVDMRAFQQTAREWIELSNAFYKKKGGAS